MGRTEGKKTAQIKKKKKKRDTLRNMKPNRFAHGSSVNQSSGQKPADHRHSSRNQPFTVTDSPKIIQPASQFVSHTVCPVRPTDGQSNGQPDSGVTPWIRQPTSQLVS